MEEYLFQILSKPYEKKIGRVTFVITSFGNMESKKTAQELLLEHLAKQKVTKNKKQQK